MLEGLGDRQDNPAGSMGHYWAGHKPDPIQKAYGASTNTRVEKQAEWYRKWEPFLEPKMPSGDSQPTYKKRGKAEKDDSRNLGPSWGDQIDERRI
jgi:hypothetical protein